MAGIREPLLIVPGFQWLGRNVGIKDDTLDFAVAYADRPCAASAVFTRNNFPGAPVIVGREHVADGRLQAVVVNSKNANVATGFKGVEHARAVCRKVGKVLDIDPRLVLPGSTGVIGVELPIERLLNASSAIPSELGRHRAHLEAFARAILTTDTRPKAVSLRVGNATLTGVAKGAAMIEPNMATMLAYFFTDAAVEPAALATMLRQAVDKSFNRISVDTDTSTSDTVAILANGLAGPVDASAFSAALEEGCIYLAQEIVRDAEGASKFIELTVQGAPSAEAALRFAKSVINSPLVKTAIHGADPNWGRFVMALGKVFDHPFPLEGLQITFGTGTDALTISAQNQAAEILADIAVYLRENSDVHLGIHLGAGNYAERVWGCDLTAEYVRLNAEYTT